MKRVLISLIAVLIAVIAVAPSAQPSAQTATASTPGKVTGGGFIIDPITGNPSDFATMLIKSGANGACVGGKATFGFVVQFNIGDPAPTGNLTYHDQACDVDLKATSFNLLLIRGNHATFAGQAQVNGVAGKDFQVDVDDNGEPGSGIASPDTFKIQIQPGGYTAAGPLIGGNIQVRTQIPIDHIIVLMQENRSFDHYFGQLRNFDPTLDVEPEPPGASNPDPTNPSGPPIKAFHQTRLCEVADLDHEWNGSHHDWNNGNMDGFTATNVDPRDPTGSRTMGFYDERELPFYYTLYTTFAVGDRYFQSLLGPTFPNRYYLLAGTSFGHIRNSFPSSPADFSQRTIFNLLDEAAVSWKIYFSDVPFASLFAYVRNQPPGKVVPIQEYFIDAAAGTLPQVAFIDPRFNGPKNVESDEHPPANPQVGQRFAFDVIDALFKSPQWQSSAFFHLYDEDGGYFDHVPPPPAPVPDNIPPMLEPGDEPGAFDRYGFRVPTAVVSPFSKKHFVSHIVYDHTSVLRFIETRFNLPALTNRDAAADPMLDFFDFQNPQFKTPPSLSPPPVDLTRPECLDP